MGKNFWLKEEMPKWEESLKEFDFSGTGKFWLKQSDFDKHTFNTVLEKFSRAYSRQNTSSPYAPFRPMIGPCKGEMLCEVHKQLMLLAAEVLAEFQNPNLECHRKMPAGGLLRKSSLSVGYVVHYPSECPLYKFNPDTHTAFMWFAGIMIDAFREHKEIYA